MLGLELQVEEGRLRFWAGSALLLEYAELIARMQEMMTGLQQRADAEARHLAEVERLRQEAQQRLAQETHRREELERRLAESQAELERLRQRGDEPYRSPGQGGNLPPSPSGSGHVRRPLSGQAGAHLAPEAEEGRIA